MLNAALLLAPELPPWDPDAPPDPSALARPLFDLVAKERRDWTAAFRLHARDLDHRATGRIVEVLRARDPSGLEVHNPPPDASPPPVPTVIESAPATTANEAENRRQRLRTAVRQLSDAREADLDALHARLTQAAAEAAEAVEEAAAQGLIPEDDRTRELLEVEGVRPDAGPTDDRPSGPLARLRKVHSRLAKSRAEMVAEARRAAAEAFKAYALDREPEPLDADRVYLNEARARIEGVLARGDLLTANAYIEQVREKKALMPRVPAAIPLRGFFPQTAGGLRRVLRPAEGGAPTPADLAGRVRLGERVGPVDFAGLPDDRRENAAALLESWSALKGFGRLQKGQKAHADAVNRFLELLGFRVRKVEIEARAAGRRAVAVVEADEIRDRELCPVAAYGSRARGRYEIRFEWDPSPPEEMTSGCDAVGPPPIVFYFGDLPDAWRLQLLRLCRGTAPRTVLVVDEPLVLYLCGQPGSRLPVLFHCTLPFTHVEPYVDGSGYVDPEMFFGRDRERLLIDAPGVAGFLYGGRQVGKTALLRRVLQEWDDPQKKDPGRVALYVDLRATGIGKARPPDHLKHFLLDELVRRGVLTEVEARRCSVSHLPTMANLLRQWLVSDPGRRLLLLLDEADEFLLSDKASGYAVVSQLTQLTQDTGRRFKVVYSGLHDVIRATRRVKNNALDHLGEPLAIGPLSPAVDGGSASELVREPLAALGYEFESEDVVAHILARTNYYPALIQLACRALLEHLAGRSWPGGGPPFVVTGRHVEEAFRSERLRQSIRNKLMLTLRLDTRYAAVAFAIAYHRFLDPVTTSVRGFTVAEVRELVAGFDRGMM